VLAIGNNGQYAELRNHSGKPDCVRFTTEAVWGTALGGLTRASSCYVPSGSNVSTTVNVSNSGSPVTQSGTNSALNNTTSITLCGRNSGGVLYKGTTASAVVLNANMTSTQAGYFETWAQGYGAP